MAGAALGCSAPALAHGPQGLGVRAPARGRRRSRASPPGKPEAGTEASQAMGGGCSRARVSRRVTETVLGTKAGRWPRPRESPERKGKGKGQKEYRPPGLLDAERRTYQQFAELLIIEHFVLILFGQLLAQGDGLLPHLREGKRERETQT